MIDATRIPTSEAEAQTIRPYIPAATMRKIGEMRREMVRKREALERIEKELAVARAEASAWRKKANRLAKEADAIKYTESLEKILDANDAAWLQGRKARDAARAAGEPARFETAEQANDRLKAEKGVAA